MTEQVQIAQIATETLLVPIVGTMPLIVHNFSEKSKRQMLDAQQGRKSPKVARDPKAEYEAAFYRTLDVHPELTSAAIGMTGRRKDELLHWQVRAGEGGRCGTTAPGRPRLPRGSGPRRGRGGLR